MDDAAGGLAFLGEELTQEHEFVETFQYHFRKQNQIRAQTSKPCERMMTATMMRESR